MEAAALSVRINGDASGLIGAVESAEAALGRLRNTAASALDGLKDKTVKISVSDNTAPGIASARAAINSLSDRTVTVSVRYAAVNAAPVALARGTENAPSGTALINDETGTADPRELIYHNGRYMLYNGRNVLVNLDRGDRVYTAAQTKNIMRSMGIKSYASGLNNSLFKAEYEEFASRTKSSRVPIDEQISWWEAAAEKYAYDAEVIRRCGEEIFSLTRKLVDSINSASDVYIDERTYFNDWQDYGDSAVEAFERVKLNNKKYLDEGYITWEEYSENTSELGTALYEGRIKQSEAWLDAQLKYNDMSTEDYIAGLERMEAYTGEYYRNGLISYRQYCDGMAEISGDIYAAGEKINSAQYRHWQSDAKNWAAMRDTYGDWEEVGDSYVDFYSRSIERVREFYEAGKIDWQTYMDDTFAYSLKLYGAMNDEADALLENMRTNISELSEKYKSEEQLLKSSWEAEDRAEDISDIRSQMSIYRYAVTQKGMDKYRALSDELESLERQEEMCRLQKEHSDKISALEEEYERAEADKNRLMLSIRGTGESVAEKCRVISDTLQSGKNEIADLITDAIAAIKNMSVNIYNQSSSTYNQSSAAGKYFQMNGMYSYYG